MASSQGTESNLSSIGPRSVPGDPPIHIDSGDVDVKLGPRTISISLGLNRSYAADWTIQDALRELYQNW